MKVRTTIILDDGSEISLDCQQSAHVGLQCPTCLSSFEITGEHSLVQVHEIVALHQSHRASCGKTKRLTQ